LVQTHHHPEAYTLSLHDALLIWSNFKAPRIFTKPEVHRTARRSKPHPLLVVIGRGGPCGRTSEGIAERLVEVHGVWVDLCEAARDRKSTRLNSSHSQISYAVFCL